MRPPGSRRLYKEAPPSSTRAAPTSKRPRPEELPNSGGSVAAARRRRAGIHAVALTAAGQADDPERHAHARAARPRLDDARLRSDRRGATDLLRSRDPALRDSPAARLFSTLLGGRLGRAGL